MRGRSVRKRSSYRRPVLTPSNRFWNTVPLSSTRSREPRPSPAKYACNLAPESPILRRDGPVGPLVPRPSRCFAGVPPPQRALTTEVRANAAGTRARRGHQRQFADRRRERGTGPSAYSCAHAGPGKGVHTFCGVSSHTLTV